MTQLTFGSGGGLYPAAWAMNAHYDTLFVNYVMCPPN